MLYSKLEVESPVLGCLVAQRPAVVHTVAIAHTPGRSLGTACQTLSNTGAMYANDRCDVCERQVAMYANDRNRDGSGRRQTATLFKPRNGGGLATSRYNI
jgi:hypothetical protein